MIHPPPVRPEEPIAVTPHDGICGGESQQWLSYPTNPHVRFDERGRETERCRMAQATAPVLDSTMDATRTRSPTWLGCSGCTTVPGVRGPYLGTCARWARTRSRSSMPMLTSKRSRNWRRLKEAG